MLVNLQKQVCLNSRPRYQSGSSKANYLVARETTLVSKLYYEGELAKTCLLNVAEIECPEKQQTLANMNLARNTLADGYFRSFCRSGPKLKLKVK